MMGLIGMVTVFGTASTFSPNYPIFLIFVWINGFASIGFGTVVYCWMMEIVTGKAKTILGLAPHFDYAIGGLMVCAVAYLIPDWYKMQLVFNIPLLLWFSIYWVIPESPRWLLTHGYVEKAEKVVKEIAEYNNHKLPDNFKLETPKSHDTNSSGSDTNKLIIFMKLFKTPNLRKNTLIVYYAWFATSFVYYGLTLNSNSLGASLFVYFSFGKVIEIPAVLTCTILAFTVGRRLSVMIMFTVCGSALLLTMAVPTGVFTNEWPIVALNIIGRGSSIGNLALCYVYTAELFPTVARNVGIGSSSLWV